VSQATVGWLMIAAAALIFVAGALSRVFVGRRRRTEPVRRVIGRFRRTRVAQLLFGRVQGDELDDDELDTMFLMPAIVVACGLCLTALFLLGYDTLV
jgi:hypothetical protein